jgi:Tripartite tricarboxylate transporter TctB family
MEKSVASPGAEAVADATAAHPTVRISSAVLDIAVALFFLAVAAWFFVGAADLPPSERAWVGPATFPQAIAILLALCALVLGAGGLNRLRTLTATWTTVDHPAAVGVAIAALVLFPVTMEYLGYYIATAALLVVMLIIGRVRGWLLCAATVLGFLAFTKLVFEMLLNVRLS